MTTPNVGGAYWTPALTQTAVQAAAYTALPNQLVPVDTTSGSVTITLPTGAPAGSLVAVKMITLGGSNTVTITAVAGDVFDKAGGSATSTLSLLGQGKVLAYQGGIWLTIADDLPLSQLDARYDQQSVLTTLGDMLYENSTPAPARLAGNTSATKNFLTQTGNSTISAAPAWGTIAAGDLPTGTTSTKGALQLDGTAGDIAALGAQAAGAIGKAADAGHVHPTTGVVLTSAIGGTYFAPVIIGAGSLSAAQTANLLVLHTVYIPVAITVTGLAVANGATATGNVLAGIYNAAGSSLLASSGSTAQTGTSSTQYVAFSGTYAAAAGTYIAAVLYSSSSATAPTAYAASPASTAAQGGFSLPASVTPPTAAAGVALAVCSTY